MHLGSSWGCFRIRRYGRRLRPDPGANLCYFLVSLSTRELERLNKDRILGSLGFVLPNEINIILGRIYELRVLLLELRI